MKKNKIKFSFGYSFDPYDSDAYWLNKSRENPELLNCRIPRLYCRLNKITTLLARAEFFNGLFSCSISLKEVRKACVAEILEYLAKSDVREIFCYILMLADGLNLTLAEHRREYKDAYAIVDQSRRDLIPKIKAELERRFPSNYF